MPGKCRLVRQGPRRPISIGGVMVGEQGKPVVIAGPCSVEDREMIRETADYIAREIVDGLGFKRIILRGGCWKPRTSPYSFQGHGWRAVEWLREAGDRAGLPVITEVMDPRHVAGLAGMVDAVWVGARNMQNTPLLLELASGFPGPVLLKRHFGALIEEWLCAAEYLLANGKEDVALIERGTRGINEYARFTLDVTVIPIVKQEARLPLVVDVSHPAGKRSLVPALARAALAAGADGIMVEVHPEPGRALSDKDQQLGLEEFRRLLESLMEMKLL